MTWLALFVFELYLTLFCISYDTHLSIGSFKAYLFIVMQTIATSSETMMSRNSLHKHECH